MNPDQKKLLFNEYFETKVLVLWKYFHILVLWKYGEKWGKY